METGYVLTYNGSDALELFDRPEVRFAAILSDGSGFIAYDGDPIGLRFFGRILPARGFFHPWFAAPKRGVGTGKEHFALVSDSFADFLMDQDYVTGLVDVGGGQLLVESVGPIAAGSVWSQSVEAFKDKRLVLV